MFFKCKLTTRPLGTRATNESALSIVFVVVSFLFSTHLSRWVFVNLHFHVFPRDLGTNIDTYKMNLEESPPNQLKSRF